MSLINNSSLQSDFVEIPTKRPRSFFSLFYLLATVISFSISGSNAYAFPNNLAFGKACMQGSACVDNRCSRTIPSSQCTRMGICTSQPNKVERGGLCFQSDECKGDNRCINEIDGDTVLSDVAEQLIDAAIGVDYLNAAHGGRPINVNTPESTRNATIGIALLNFGLSFASCEAHVGVCIPNEGSAADRDVEKHQCWDDWRYKLDRFLKNSGATHASCARDCRNDSDQWSIYGIEYGDQCFCGTTSDLMDLVENHKQVPGRECNMPCKDSRDGGNCGGLHRINIAPLY